MKERLKNLAEAITSKRALLAVGMIVGLSFISNALAMICATAIAITYIICNTIEKIKG